GMLLSQATAVLPLVLGGSVLQSAAFEYDLPVFGAVKLTTVLFFDIGVLLIVMGLVAKALDTLGGADPADVGDGPATIASARRADTPPATPSAAPPATPSAAPPATPPATPSAAPPATSRVASPTDTASAAADQAVDPPMDPATGTEPEDIR
ncbi:MAG TPA: MnhB domain-containing protein, partial [Euzebya sp.]|nr:MnhB domain-containing protein [Euzebya sp.]